jgi:hypothetical protein
MPQPPGQAVVAPSLANEAEELDRRSKLPGTADQARDQDVH